MKYKIIDDFLPIHKFNTIRKDLESENFPWYWNSHSTGYDFTPQFVHKFMEGRTGEITSGYFEVWNDDMTECTNSFAPLNNRLVIFHNSDTSYHGVPEVKRERKSITWSVLKSGEVSDRSKALFVSRPQDDKKMNFLKSLFYKISEYSYAMFRKNKVSLIRKDENFLEFALKKIIKNIKASFFFSVHIILLQKYYVDSLKIIERKNLFDMVRMTYDENE